MNIERRYSGGFDVYVPSNFGRAHIDTVYFTSYTREEARRSLIDHDGYDSNIIVIPPLEGIIPLNERELESLCDDNDVRVVQATEAEALGRWDWLDDNGNASDMSFGTKVEAMRDAVDRLELDDNGAEDEAE